MDYSRFDALGNRVTGDPATPASAALTEAANPRRPPDDDGDDSSGFGSDVEILVEQIADDSGAPLARPADGPESTDGPSASKPLLLIKEQTQITAAAAAVAEIAPVLQRQRIVVVTGALHAGKTSLAQLLASSEPEIAASQPSLASPEAQQRELKQRFSGRSGKHKRPLPFTPTPDETHRLVTLQTRVQSSFVSGDVHAKGSHLLTLFDTPGHPSFAADMHGAVRLADCALVCVDATDVIGAQTEAALRLAVLEGLRVVLVVTKLDRLLLDVHLPPHECYLKLKHIVDAANNVIASCGAAETSLVSPVAGTVWFTSARLGIFFTVDSFARKYSEVFGGVDAAVLASRLWGPVRFDADARRFAKVTLPTQRTTFVTLILEPLYKVVSHALGGKGAALLSDALVAEPKGPLAAVREAVVLYLGHVHSAAVDALVRVAPAPDADHGKALASSYSAIDDSGEVVAPVVRLVCTSTALDASGELLAIGRVISGTITAGCTLVAVGEGDDLQTAPPTAVASALFMLSASGLLPVPSAAAGAVIAVQGLAASMLGTHVLFGSLDAGGDLVLPEVPSLSAPKALAHVSMECEPSSSATLVADTKKFKAAARKVSLMFPGLGVSVEETGVFTMSGLGELQLEAALTELRRRQCRDMRLKLSHPFVSFAETVANEAGVLAVDPPNEPPKKQLAMTANRMVAELTSAIEYQRLPLGEPADDDRSPLPIYTVLRKDYGFDAFAASRGLLALGPDTTKGPNCLVDDSIDGDWAANEDALLYVAEGFRAGTAEGPLCGGPVRGVRFELIGGALRPSAKLQRSAAELTHWALMGAHPRLMEPVAEAEIITQPKHMDRLKLLLERRRGHVVSEYNVPASPLVVCRAVVPLTDHFGLETQIRAQTAGEAFPTFRFDHWAVVPGDPFDRTSAVGLLQPARGHQLARDFVLKTRSRKGLPVDPEDRSAV